MMTNALLAVVTGVQGAQDLLQQCCLCCKTEVNVAKTVGLVMNRRYHKGSAVRWMYMARR